MKNYIIIAIVAVLCIFCITNQVRYSKLQREYLTLQLNQPKDSDSLKFINKQLNNKIYFLENQIQSYSNKIDSLKKVKRSVVVKYEFTESSSLSEGVMILKNNLQCEK